VSASFAPQSCDKQPHKWYYKFLSKATQLVDSFLVLRNDAQFIKRNDFLGYKRAEPLSE
jgi:hypothetical protein